MIRRRWAVLIPVVLVLAACGGGGSEPLLVGLPYSDYAHEGEPFARELYAEQATKVATPSDKQLFFISGDAYERYTHVADHVRRTPTSVAGAPVVWFFGGSTMFGIGQRDQHTIPAELARIADDAGTPIDARNYGTSGYVAWQEAELLGRLMQTEPRPDLIVFLHGVNDFSQTCRHLAAGIDPLTRTNPLTDEPLGSSPAIDCVADPAASGQAMAGVVDAAMAQATRYADGVPVVEFWQAMAQARKPHPSDEGLLERLDETRSTFDRSAAVYGRRSPRPARAASI